MRAEGICDSVWSKRKEGRNVENIMSKNGKKHQSMIYKVENTRKRYKLKLLLIIGNVSNYHF